MFEEENGDRFGQLPLTTGSVSSSDLERLPTVPDIYALLPNYPNPFNSSTMIEYHLPETALTQITIMNVLGQIVVNLVNDYQPAGVYRIHWNTNDFPSGIYFLHMETDRFSKTHKMVLLK